MLEIVRIVVKWVSEPKIQIIFAFKIINKAICQLVIFFAAILIGFKFFPGQFGSVFKGLFWNLSLNFQE